MYLICKHCKAIIIEDRGSYKTPTLNNAGYYYYCQNGPYKLFPHQPMDNLDYIEYLVKQKNLL